MNIESNPTCEKSFFYIWNKEKKDFIPTFPIIDRNFSRFVVRRD